jgi:hypothetical protein
MNGRQDTHLVTSSFEVSNFEGGGAPTLTTAEAKALEHLAERLRHDSGLPAATIDSAITEALAEFAGRPIRDFIPILVEREVKDRLASMNSAARGDAVPVPAAVSRR